MMKFFDKLVVIDAKNSKATNLSIAAGALKLLSILLVIGAILLTLGIFFIGLRPVAAMGLAQTIWYLLEELDGALLCCFILWCASILCAFVSSVLRAKAMAMMSDSLTDSSPDGTNH